MIEAFGPDKTDVIYDCAGNNITMGQAIKYARKGDVIVLVVVFAGMVLFSILFTPKIILFTSNSIRLRHQIK